MDTVVTFQDGLPFSFSLFSFFFFPGWSLGYSLWSMSFRLSPIGVGLGLEPRKTQPMGATINFYGGVVSCALIHTTFAGLFGWRGERERVDESKVK